MDGEIGGDFPENAWTRLLTFPLVALPFQESFLSATLKNRSFDRIPYRQRAHN